LAGVALVASGSRQFAAVAFSGEGVIEELEGRLDDRQAAQRLRELADGLPIVTDASPRAIDLAIAVRFDLTAAFRCVWRSALSGGSHRLWL